MDWVTAASVVAEGGTDMDVFASAPPGDVGGAGQGFTGYAGGMPVEGGGTPGNYESAGKLEGAGTRRGNVLFESTLFAASTAMRIKGSYHRNDYSSSMAAFSRFT